MGYAPFMSSEFRLALEFHAAPFTLEQGLSGMRLAHMKPELFVFREGRAAVGPCTLVRFGLLVQFLVAGQMVFEGEGGSTVRLGTDKGSLLQVG